MMSATTQPAANRTVIRKNTDRRLYHGEGKRYVKLEDIARMIREGQDVEVMDARTGKDITSVILTQIIVEDTRNGEAGPPLPLLKQLVRASDRATHEFLSWYLNNTMELYQKAQQAVQSRLSDARSAVAGPLEFVRGLLSGGEAMEIEQLRARVQELEARVAELSRPAKPRKAAARRKR
jgi:polyhydroxyalkanoate synthesis repressor PhaR